MKAEEVEEVKQDLDKEIKNISGIKGFLVKQLWPLVKDLILNILVGLITKKVSKRNDNK